ncbi:MAG: competence/damage-inducible protein A [Anaerostipes faecalis]|nr:competence/damage-inducible protein A [Anaerostipes faecalis]
MTAEIICVGTEILLGNIVNTNAAYLSERLAALGISVFFETTVGDNPERLESVIKQGLERSDILILSGGLGPTKDDLTKEIAAKVCGQKLIEDQEALKRLKEYFTSTKRKMTENNLKQAMVPENCTVLYNDNGTAPGMVIHASNGKKVILLPGPPSELLPMFHRQVEPVLQEMQPGILYSKVIKIDCMGESAVETEILDLIEQQSNPTVAPYAKLGEVHLRVTAKADTMEEGKELVKPMVAELRNRFGNKIYTIEGDRTLEDVLVEMLDQKGYTISAAESCTAGMFMSRLVNVPGASNVVNESFITYSNEAKMKYLGVKEETLMNYGAVSEETAREMAEGVARKASANVGVGITGLAGPGGETPEKKPGLVYIGVCINGKTKVNKYQLKGNRQKVREVSVSRAMTMVRLGMLEEK